MNKRIKDFGYFILLLFIFLGAIAIANKVDDLPVDHWNAPVNKK